MFNLFKALVVEVLIVVAGIIFGVMLCDFDGLFADYPRECWVAAVIFALSMVVAFATGKSTASSQIEELRRDNERLSKAIDKNNTLDRDAALYRALRSQQIDSGQSSD